MSKTKPKQKTGKKQGVLLAAASIGVLFLAALFWEIFRTFGASREMVDQASYYHLSGDDGVVLSGADPAVSRAVFYQGEWYILLQDLQKTEPALYGDEETGCLLFFDKSFPEGKDVLKKDGSWYVSCSLAKELGLPVLTGARDGIRFFWIKGELSESQEGWRLLKCDTIMRTGGSVQKAVVTTLLENTPVWMLSVSGHWAFVLSAEGIGYVPVKNLEQGTLPQEMKSWLSFTPYTKEPHHLTGPVKLGWHMIDYISEEPEGMLDKLLAGETAWNVISPTWFTVTDEAGHIRSYADAAYVKACHERGLQVWALIDNFTPEVDNLKLLKSSSARKTLTDSLIREAKACGFDGINVDFEAKNGAIGGISASCGPHFLQWLRELSEETEKAGLVLSVDNYVPAPYNSYYQRSEQARCVDYLMIMAYDEHYAGGEPGSTSSYDFVAKALAASVKEVWPSSLLLGIPTYTRLWKYELVQGEEGLTYGALLGSETKGMKQAAELLSELSVTPVWQEKERQYLAEFPYGEKYARIWLEEETSLNWRLSLAAEYELAGIAAWRLGILTDEAKEVVNAWNP